MKKVLFLFIFSFSLNIFGASLEDLVSREPKIHSKVAFEAKRKYFNFRLGQSLDAESRRSLLSEYTVFMASQGHFESALAGVEKLLNISDPQDRYKIHRVLKLPILFALRQKHAEHTLDLPYAIDNVIASYLLTFLERGNFVQYLSKGEIKREKKNLILSFLLGRIIEYQVVENTKLPPIFTHLLHTITYIKAPITTEKLQAHKKELAFIKNAAARMDEITDSHDESIYTLNLVFFNYLTGKNMAYLNAFKGNIIKAAIPFGHNPSRGEYFSEIIATIEKHYEGYEEIREYENLHDTTETLKKVNGTMASNIKKAREDKRKIYFLSPPKGLSKTKRELIEYKKELLKHTFEKYKAKKALLDEVKRKNSLFSNEVRTKCRRDYNALKKSSIYAMDEYYKFKELYDKL